MTPSGLWNAGDLGLLKILKIAGEPSLQKCFDLLVSRRIPNLRTPSHEKIASVHLAVRRVSSEVK
jgi:hypothetical protein